MERGGVVRGAAPQADVMLRALRDIVTVVDADGLVKYVNDAPAAVLGLVPAEAGGTSALSYVHPDDVTYALGRRRWLLAEPGRSVTTVMRVRCATGWRRVETTGVNLLHDPAVLGVLYLTRDVEDKMTDHEDLSGALERQQWLLELALQALRSDDLDAFLSMALARVAELLATAAVTLAEPSGAGSTRLRLRVAPPVQQIDEQSNGPIVSPRWPALHVPVAGPEGEVGTLSAAGRPRPYTSQDTALLQGVADVLAGALVQGTRHSTAVTQALHDALTGLATRPLLEERLERTLSRPGQVCAVLLIDLDRFKVVNDTFGHASGDAVLRALGPRLRGCVRPGDTVARYGGDEFVVLCENVTDRGPVEQLANRIRSACTAPFLLPGGEQILLSASVGVGWSADVEPTADALLAAADAAMYRHKRSPDTPSKPD